MTRKSGKKVTPVPLSEVIPTAEEKKIFTSAFLKKSVDQAVRSATKGTVAAISKRRRPT